MASSATIDKFACNNTVEMYYHDPATATTEQSVKAGATTTTWKDMRDFEGFAVGAMSAVMGGSGMIEVSIYAADDTSATNAIEVKTSGVVACDAVGDWAFLECTVEELRQLSEANSYNLRYVTAYVDCQHADDTVAVVYIRYGAKHPQDTLTAATTIA